MKIHSQLSLLSASLLLAASCGRLEKKSAKDAETKNPESGVTIPTGTTQEQALLEDDRDEESVAGDHVDEVADSLGDPAQGSVAGASLAEEPMRSMTSSCEAQSDGSALIKQTFDAKREGSKNIRKIALSFAASQKAERSVIWSKQDAKIECGQGMKHANITWSDSSFVTGLKASYSFRRETSQKHEVGARALSRTHEVEGKRNMEWISQTNNQETKEIVRKSKLTSSVTRKGKKIEAKSGASKEFSGEQKVEILEDAPLLVTVTRDAETEVWKQRLIESGKIVAVRANGKKVTTTFENLLFKKSDESCSPVSGSFKSEFFGSDGVLKRSLKVTIKATDDGSEASLVRCKMVSGVESCASPVEFTELSIRGCSLEN